MKEIVGKSVEKSWNGTDSPGLGFPRAARLLRRSDFEAVYRGGTRRGGTNFAVFARSSGLGNTRFGISVKKALGGAVVRNRIRRRVREILRLHRSEIPQGWDIVVHPRPSVARAKFAGLEEELVRLIRSTTKAAGA